MHILHVTRFAQWLKDKDCIITTPYLLTMGGTDVHVDLPEGKWDERTWHLVAQAKAITFFTGGSKQMVIEEARLQPWFTTDNGQGSTFEHKCWVVPQGVAHPPFAGYKQPTWKQRTGWNVVFPAGLRPVKDVLHLLPAWISLQELIPQFKVILVGEPIDADTVGKVRKAIKHYSFITYEGAVPFEEMGAYYELADVVVNSSIEEGQPTAIGEAMALGVPVIARNNVGNRGMIHSNQTGYLYHTLDQFVQQVMWLYENRAKKDQLTRAAKRFIEEHRSVDQEVAAYIKLLI